MVKKSRQTKYPPLSMSVYLFSSVMQVFLVGLSGPRCIVRQVLSGDHTTCGTVRPSPTLLISIERRLWFPMPNGE